MSKYQDLITEQRDLVAMIESAKAEHQRELLRFTGELERVSQAINYAEKGGDPSDFEIARQALAITWARNSTWQHPPGALRVTPEVLDQIDKAVGLLRDNSNWLQRNYLGVKQYDGFASQISNAQKGYGPRHGSIWFRITLTPRFSTALTEQFTEAERLACIRYLQAIKQNPEMFSA